MRKIVFAVPEQQRRRSDCTVGHCSYRQVGINSMTFQRLLKASPTVFKDLKLMQKVISNSFQGLKVNAKSDLSVKILLQKC